VLDDFEGRLEHSWRSTERRPTESALIVDLFNGQHNDPVRSVAFNIAEGWSPRVSCRKSPIRSPNTARATASMSRASTVGSLHSTIAAAPFKR
jgi:hypothetical protein